MGRNRETIPPYALHPQSGRGRIRYYDAAGKRRDEILPGAYNSKESKDAYARRLIELNLAPAQPRKPDAGGLSLAEAIELYHQYAVKTYVKSGKPTSELREHNLVVRTMRTLYGEEPTTRVAPLMLEAIREQWVKDGLSRKEVNRRLGIAKRIVRWMVAKELDKDKDGKQTINLPGIEAVEGLRKGRTEARETEPVGPVDDAKVDATLPHLNRFVAGLVELQRLTGMRPGEACIIRRRDIDTGGPAWLYRPSKHKNEHRGKSRVVAIGPKAQELLKQFFTPDLDSYLFPPRLAVAEMHAARTKARETPLYPSHARHNKKQRTKKPSRKPADHYPPESYAHAVAKACDRAFPPPPPLAQREGETAAQWEARLTEKQHAELRDWRHAHRWHPNQLRHSFATRVRKQHGLEAAQVMLGHARADVTQIYAAKNEAAAVIIAQQMG